ncbi:hypothetical protein [Hymenobacter sp. CRA2]|uniref:hypothetical protein n=1 Tax=Hymenobacter sp. CRA2 TaxID=1955620 RepID=UPI001590ED6E|nr:hypothetical protein [Hymenobacter sp. CRA2]
MQVDHPTPFDVFITPTKDAAATSGFNLVVVGAGAFPITKEHIKTLESQARMSANVIPADLAAAGLLMIMLRRESLQ